MKACKVDFYQYYNYIESIVLKIQIVATHTHAHTQLLSIDPHNMRRIHEPWQRKKSHAHALAHQLVKSHWEIFGLKYVKLTTKWVPHDEGYIDNNALYVALVFMNRRKMLENKIKKTTTTAAATTAATAATMAAAVIKLFKTIIDQRPVHMDYYEIFNLQGRPTVAKQRNKIKRNKATAKKAVLQLI